MDTLETDVENFLKRFEDFRKDKEETLMRATESDTEKEEQEPTSSWSNYGLNIFTNYPDLKPKFLEKQANLIEVNTWIRPITHNIKTGYRNNPHKKGVYMHLSPPLHQIWNSALDNKNPEEKSLEELTELVQEEAKIRMTKHQRRMHSDYLEKISEQAGAELGQAQPELGKLGFVFEVGG